MTEKQVRQEVYNALQMVTAANAANVFEGIQTESGYQNIEDMMINMMIDDNMTASATIPHIETML